MTNTTTNTTIDIPSISAILDENDRRNATLVAPFNPLTGEGSTGQRVSVTLSDVNDSPTTFFLPESMMAEPLARAAADLGSIERAARQLGLPLLGLVDMRDAFHRLRCRHDFAYWAASHVRIKPKQGGDDVPFVLNRPQRRLVEAFEAMRLAGQPIRVIVLKARQWGGSTVTQIYMAWLQLMQQSGLNSLIVGHVKTASAEVCGMFDKMMEAYPETLLYPRGTQPPKGTKKMTGDRNTRLLRHIPARNCKIKVGSAETPDSARGGDSALVHCTEVAFWRKTQNKQPEDIIRSACSGAGYLPGTMIVYESTANGTGNFFHREYEAAKKGCSQFRHLFVAWWQIEQYALPFADEAQRTAFATALYEGRHSETAAERTLAGRYLWRLWDMGATLEALHWYTLERRKYVDQADLSAEFPSDDIEAFKHSGANVFDSREVELLRPHCRLPTLRGELVARAEHGSAALDDLRFQQSDYGLLWLWRPPSPTEPRMSHRYMVVVDIGGRSAKSDWSVIAVFDRAPLTSGGVPEVCAQWYGHTDMDRLAWKAAQVARYYDNALLVVESNTLETHGPSAFAFEGGDQSLFILNEIREVYDNLYARPQSADEIRQRAPVRYGFHTNVRTKPAIISTLIAMVRDGLYVERDERCLDELLTYERRPNGSYGAIDGCHDDLLMTRAIALHLSYHELPQPSLLNHKLTRPHRPHIYVEH